MDVWSAPLAAERRGGQSDQYLEFVDFLWLSGDFFLAARHPKIRGAATRFFYFRDFAIECFAFIFYYAETAGSL